MPKLSYISTLILLHMLITLLLTGDLLDMALTLILCSAAACFMQMTVNGPYLLDNLMIKLRLPVVLYVSFAVGS